MPLVQRSDSIAATSTTENVLTGSLYERAPYAAYLEFAFNQSATGLEIDVYTGDSTITERLIPLIKTTAPIYPEDFVLVDAVGPGELIKVRVRNTTGGALTLLTTVRITPI